ncbi:MAG: AAA family ATPase [Opitutales bacterium]
MIARVAVFGAESTGKSTLAARLAEHFDEPWAPEFVREFWDLKQGRITAEDLGTIALGQMANEDRALGRARRVLFCDTELLTNVLWADLLFPGRCPAWERTEAELRCRNFGLYLLCDTDLPFQPDPQRCYPDPEGRAMCRRRWRETLTSRGLPMVEISGGRAERESRAIAAVEALLKGT